VTQAIKWRGGAWIGADWYKARKDSFASRPDKCKAATARIVESTGGLFKAGGGHDDIVEIAGEPNMTVEIDCGSSDDTVSIYSDGQYLPDRWFTVAAMAAHGLTGDPVGEITKAARSCLENGTMDGYNYAELSKTALSCKDAALFISFK
jgi:hypothetical protein